MGDVQSLQLLDEILTQELAKLNFWQLLGILLGRRHFVGYQTHPGWYGKLPSYLYLCRHCVHLSISYRQGYPQEDLLVCCVCLGLVHFAPWKVFFHRAWQIAIVLWFLIRPPQVR